jgi:hypothetical protein
MRTYVAAFGLLAASLALGQGYIGRVDTVGGTTYDWQMSWGAQRRLVNAPGYGLHAVWVWSLDNSGGFPDRNLHYNYYDFALRAWNFIDPDPMQSGVSVFTHRVGIGGLAGARPASGAAVVYSYKGTTGAFTPMVARDAAAGTGVFDYADGPRSFLWPVAAVGSDDAYHVAMLDDSGSRGLCYSRVTLPVWDSVRPIAQVESDMYSIAAARGGPEVCVCWTSAEGEVFLRISTDGGRNWLDSASLPLPPAFGGDTVPAFSLLGPFPFYDSQDRLHFVVPVLPVVHDTQYVMPTEIWHWCAQNSPNWSRVHRAGCRPENMQGGVGYNAAYAGRPSLGEDDYGRLYVAWEQFDSSNVEPSTNRLRAGIWLSGSPDNGATWMPGVMITERNTYSHRFPSIIDRMVPGGASGDTVCVLYMIDSVAGFYVQGEGPASLNPIVCQFVPAPEVGVEESRPLTAYSSQPTATILSGASSVRRLASGVLYDAMGRRVFDPKPGVYFIGEGLGARDQGLGRMRKVLITR